MDLVGAYVAHGQCQNGEVTSQEQVAAEQEAYNPLDDAQLCAELGVYLIEWE